jgi:hypothetical protein
VGLLVIEAVIAGVAGWIWRRGQAERARSSA